MWQTDETIVAIASAAGGAARGIVRMSGVDCVPILQRCLVDANALTAIRRASQVISAEFQLANSFPLPCELYVWQTNASYTRQPTVEIHTLGSPPLLERVVQLLCEQGARLARPGEFTLRAFLAGRIDLTQAEAVLGVIESQTDRELQIALKQLAGGLATPLSVLQNDLLNLLADLEAELDFVDEDIEFVSQSRLNHELRSASDRAANLLEKLQLRTSTQARMRIVLYGSANAGKSSLFNALSIGQQALVSPVAGTTRDYLQAELELDGIPCLLLDTAGVETNSPQDNIAQAAQAQLQTQRDEAHIRLFCVDGSQPLDPFSQTELERVDPLRLIVQTKSDLTPLWNCDEAISVSTLQPGGCELLKKRLATFLLSQLTTNSESVGTTAVRCREALTQAAHHLESALTACQSCLSREFIAGDLRLAVEDLGLVLGSVVTDDILDRIFSRFCIGK
jgi:tRNA modification GTPase